MDLKLLMATGFLGLAGSVGACAPASATLIDVIYKGTVHSGDDEIGLFGPAGADLAGDSFVATFEMDTSKGTNSSTPTANNITGGVFYGTESPMIAATLEINGKSYTVDGGYKGGVESALDDPLMPNLQYQHASDAASNSLALEVENASGASGGNIPFTIDVPFDFVLTSSDTGSGGAQFHSGGLITGLDLAPTELIYQYPSPGAVPEPSTWAMLLVGFGGLGLFGCRKTQRPGCGTSSAA
jgi:PEP-CTERM motif